MSVRPRGATVLVALLLAALAAFAAPALASPVTATIRVKGSPHGDPDHDARDRRPSDRLDLLRRQGWSSRGSRTAHGASALTLLADAAAANGLPLGCTWFDDAKGLLRRRVSGRVPGGRQRLLAPRRERQGRDASGSRAPRCTRATGSTSSRRTTRARAAAPDARPVGDGRARAAPRSPSRSRASTRPASARPGPAANAVVSYGSLQAVADANGASSFMGTGTGFASISATLAGRDARRRSSASARTAPIRRSATSRAGDAGDRRRLPRHRAARTPISTASTATADRIAPSTPLLGAARVREGQAGQAARRGHRARPLRHRERQLRAREARRHALQLPARQRHARTRRRRAPSAIWLPATGRAFWHVTPREAARRRAAGARSRARPTAQATSRRRSSRRPASPSPRDRCRGRGGRAPRVVSVARRSGGGEARGGVPGGAGPGRRARRRGGHRDRARRPPARSPGAHLARLRALVPAGTRTPGAAAKAALAAEAVGANPRCFAGVDLVARIRAGYGAGVYGATVFDDSLAITALVGAGEPVPRGRAARAAPTARHAAATASRSPVPAATTRTPRAWP